MVSKESRKGLRTWIEIDKKAISHNFSVFRKLIPKTTKLMAVVKSNAYGHGLIDFSREIVSVGADALAVDSVVEGLALRREGIDIPILVLGYTLPELVEEAVKNNLTLTVSHFGALIHIAGLNLLAPAKIHIKVDTGMHRQGFLPEEKNAVIEFLKKSPDKIVVEGLYTHFASAKDPKVLTPTHEQRVRFEEWQTSFRNAGIEVVSHAAATAGTIVFPETAFDMVRIGAGLYGIWPSEMVQKNFENKISLRRSLSWKTLISEIKNVPKGEKIGYDGTHILEKDTAVAVCPVGYWHGLPRALSNKGHVLIDGVQCPILGRVAMDMITVDVTNVSEVSIGSEVVIIGKSGKEEISPETVVSLIPESGTSTYELLTRLNPLIKRIYFESE